MSDHFLCALIELIDHASPALIVQKLYDKKEISRLAYIYSGEGNKAVIASAPSSHREASGLKVI